MCFDSYHLRPVVILILIVIIIITGKKRHGARRVSTRADSEIGPPHGRRV